MSAAQRLQELHLQMQKASRQPSSYAVSAEIRFLARAIRETELEFEAELAALRASRDGHPFSGVDMIAGAPMHPRKAG